MPTGGDIPTGTQIESAVIGEPFVEFGSGGNLEGVGFAFTLPEMIPPTIINNMAASTGPLNTDTGFLVNIDFSDLGGSHLDRFEIRLGTGPWMLVQDTSNFGTTLDLFNTDWALPAGAFAAMEEGNNSISVQVFDQAGNSSSTVNAFQFIKDTQGPPAPTLIAPADAFRTDNPLINFDWSDVADAVSGLKDYELQVASDAAFTIIVFQQFFVASDASVTLTEGSYYWRVRARDQIDNIGVFSAVQTFLIDLTNPTIVNNMGAGAINAWFNADPGSIIDVDFFNGGGSHLDRFETRVTQNPDGSGTLFQDWTVVQSTNDFGAVADSFTTNWALASGTFGLMQEGINYVSLRVFDQVGRTNTPLGTADFQIQKDITAPVVPATNLQGAGGTGLQGPLPATANTTRNILWCATAVAPCTAADIATDALSGLFATPVSLYYSTNNGVDFILIAASQANTGTFAWNIPDINSNQVVMRITYSDQAGNTGFDLGNAFSIGQPDLDLVTGTVAERITVLQNPNRYRLQSHVLNSGLANVPGGEDVNFTGTFPAVNCAPGDTCDFNQNQTLIGGPINPGTRNNVTMNFADKPLPGTYTDAITITADADLSLFEISEANNTMPVSVVVDATNNVSVGACAVHPLFSKTFLKFSGISVFQGGNEIPLLTTNEAFDFVDLHNTLTQRIAAAGVLNGSYTGVRLAISSVTGILADTNQTVDIPLTSPYLDVVLPFEASSASLTTQKILIDLSKSIKETNPGVFEFTPTLLSGDLQKRAAALTITPSELNVSVGQTAEFQVTLQNTGTMSDTFDLGVFIDREDMFSELPSSITLAPQASASFTLKLTAPANIGALDQIDIPFQLGAASSFLKASGGFLAMASPVVVFGTLRIITAPPTTQIFMKLDPDSLNLKSNGQYATAILEPSGSKTAADISTSTIKITAINGSSISPISIVLHPIPSLGDSNSNGITDWIVKFDRQALQTVVPEGNEVQISVEGLFKDSSVFTATDTVKVIKPGKGKASVESFSIEQAAFQLGEVYAFPNPAVGGTEPRLHIETGLADSVHIILYTLSGDLIRDETLSGAPQLIDDGQGPQYAYEWAWSGHIPSGTYFYLIETQKGSETLRAKGKIYVVR